MAAIDCCLNLNSAICLNPINPSLITLSISSSLISLTPLFSVYDSILRRIILFSFKFYKLISISYLFGQNLPLKFENINVFFPCKYPSLEILVFIIVHGLTPIDLSPFSCTYNKITFLHDISSIFN